MKKPSCIGSCCLGKQRHLRKHSGSIKKKLNDDYSAAVKEVEAITPKISEINNRRIKLMSYINDLREKTLILEQWDTSLWITMIKHCVVHRDDSITFVFRDGEEITI